ncbi:hypothetical protein [Luteimonas terrae]|uniref:DUF2570 domain-containing protein n=1 Tax=Luteimonas terrae TaxID=1530191 RepID=A0ABU1XX79_9GAMM|nr:hypothetical protein [Luteimonas terrae]MDR7193365.1 hypothetical protein [Luteimonas terrae]
MNAILGWLIAGALGLATLTGGLGYWAGKRAERTACERDTATAAIAPAQKLAKRDAAIDSIADDTATQRATGAYAITSQSHEVIERIRTVEVPGDCTRVPDGIVREHTATRADVNAQIRGSVRPATAGPGAASPDIAP